MSGSPGPGMAGPPPSCGDAPRRHGYPGRVHEYSVARALRRMVEERVRAERGAADRGERRAPRVTRVEVAVGALSGVVPELLATAWGHVRGGACAAAELRVRDVPACWRCGACGGAVPEGGPLHCGACGAPAELAGGAELDLERIQMEVG